MATLQTRIDNARTLNNVDVNQYNDTQALLHSNQVIHQIEDFITKAIWEKYFWSILTAQTTVINQNEYTLPKLSTWLFNGADKIESISIQYRADEEFIKATEVSFDTLENDLSWYNANQSEAEPIYFIADNSIFIYPAPKVAIEWWIKFYGIRWLRDVTLSTNDTDLFWWKIPTKYYHLISDWLEEFILRTIWKKQEAIQARDRFQSVLLPELIDTLWNRRTWIIACNPINVNKYKNG